MILNFGLVGTGRITDWVLRGAMMDPRFRAAAVCSRNPDSARAFIEAHPQAFPGGAEVFTSVEEMASSPAVDAVYIGTPNVTHLPYALSVLRNGKAVLCEKPLGCSADEVERMIEASHRWGAPLMEAVISTLNPNFRILSDSLDRIWPVHRFNAVFCQYSSRMEALRGGVVSNSFNPRMGGGALEDIGIYTVYPMLSLFGEPARVRSALTRVPSPVGDVETGGTAILEYPGMSGTLSWSKAVDSLTPTEVCGEKGNLLIDNVHNARRTLFLPHAAPSSGRGPSPVPEVLGEIPIADDYFYEFREFISVVERGALESDVNTHSLSLQCRRVMDRIKNIDQ